MPTIMGALATCAIAWAQDGDINGIDAHGMTTRPSDGDPVDPLYTWRPVRQSGFSAGGTLDIGQGLLYRYVQVADDTGVVHLDRYPVLATAAVLNLGASYAFAPRVGVGVVLPIAVLTREGNGEGFEQTRSLGLSDPQLSVPVGLVLPAPDGTGFGLSVVPTFNLAIGAKSRALGDGRSSVGLVLAPGWSSQRLSLSSNLGFHSRGWEQFGTVDEAGFHSALFASFAAGYRLNDGMGVVAELWVEGGGDVSALPEEARGILTPAELSLSLRGRTDTGVYWHGTIATGLTKGIGSSELRILGGLGFGPKPPAGALERFGEEPMAFTVLDPEGKPVPNAVILAGSTTVGETDPAGHLTAPLSWKKPVTVNAMGFDEATVSRPDGDAATVTLRWSPVAVAFEVRDEQGRSVPAKLTATPVDGGDGLGVDAAADGHAKLDLRPGRYRFDIAAPAYGRQERDVLVSPGAKLRSVEVLLLPDEGDGAVQVRISDLDGQPVETARLLLDGRPIGNAGSGGRVLVGDVKDATHRVEVSADGFETLEERDVKTTAGTLVSRDVVLQRVPGSVKVVARTGEGRVVDAVVRIEGRPIGADTPVRLAPTPLGEVGERIFVLRPGTWKVLVASPKYGVQTRDLVIRPEDVGLLVVDVVLQPAEDGKAELIVRVIDPEGSPVEDAKVAVDGQVVGRTSTGGTVDLIGLSPGSRKLSVSADYHREHEPVSLFLVEGVQEHVDTLEWNPGTVRITAHTPDKPVGDGTARFSGTATVAPLPLGPRGRQITQLPDGTWKIVIASPTAGVKQRKIEVPPDSRSLLDVDVVLTPSEGGTAELDLRVVDPTRSPVPGARVTLDAEPLGTTGTTGALSLSELDPGRRTLSVVATAFQPKKQPVALQTGTQSAEVKLDWAPGAVQVVVRAGGEPLTDAVVRFVGAGTLPPQPVNRDGRRIVQLATGKWQAVVLSPSQGLAQQDVVIIPDQRGLQTVEFDLDGLAANESEVLLQIRDPDGRPVPSAEVKLARVAKGITRAGGSLLLGGLAPGKQELYVVAPQFEPVTIPAFEIAPGVTERIVTLDWVPVALAVTVTDAQKKPLDAEIRFDGPKEVAPRKTGADGREEFELRPGTWQVLASTRELGVQRKTVRVEPGGAAQEVTLVLTPAKVEASGGTVTIKDQVYFDFNSAVIGPQSTSILDEVAATLLARPDIVRLEVQGHTDDVGDLAYNLELSKQRAEAVVAALVKRGVAAERLTAAGYGATRPLFANDTDTGRAANRRVQFEVGD